MCCRGGGRKAFPGTKSREKDGGENTERKKIREMRRGHTHIHKEREERKGTEKKLQLLQLLLLLLLLLLFSPFFFFSSSLSAAATTTDDTEKERE